MTTNSVKTMTDRISTSPSMLPTDIVIEDWLACERFLGAPQPRQYLVEPLFPLGVLSLFVTFGKAENTSLLVQLARDVANRFESKSRLPPLFDCPSMVEDAVVYITTKHDYAEMHQCLYGLGEVPDQLYVVPLQECNACGNLFEVDPLNRMPTTTPFWDSLVNQLKTIPGLRAIIFDSLQPLCALDLTVQVYAQFVCTRLSDLARETGTSIIVSQHVDSNAVTTFEQASDVIQGADALANVARFVYALWPASPSTAEAVCPAIHLCPHPYRVVEGGVIASNGRSAPKTTLYIFNEGTRFLENVSSSVGNTFRHFT